MVKSYHYKFSCAVDVRVRVCSVSELKRELTVSLINFHGLGEAGIDGGGVLR